MSEPIARTYLGVPLVRPAAAFFELSSCEGCQLQVVNNESSLLEFLSLVRVVNFREAMTERSDTYDVAFIEGSVTRQDEIERISAIRRNAKTVVAFGSCACFGGVNQLRNRFTDVSEVKRRVYGEHPVDTREKALPLDAFISVDVRIFGCPVRKEEVETIVLNLALGKTFSHPKYPVCMECKANSNHCLFDMGEPCLGPVTRGGCNAWCPNNRAGCWGCRGPAEDANIEQMKVVMKRYGFSERTILDRMECFGGFAKEAEEMRKGTTRQGT